MRAMPHDGILRAATARARRNGVTLGTRLDSGETQRSLPQLQCQLEHDFALTTVMMA